MGRASGRKKQRRESGSGEGHDAVRRLGSHYTPAWLARRVVRKTLEPLLMWMEQDPEGWDRSHPRPKAPEPPRAADPRLPGCPCNPASHLKRRECPVHGIAAEQRIFDGIRRQREEDAASMGPLTRARIAELVPAYQRQIRAMSPYVRRFNAKRTQVEVSRNGVFSVLAGPAEEGTVGEYDPKTQRAFERGVQACARALAHLSLNEAPGGFSIFGFTFDHAGKLR